MPHQRPSASGSSIERARQLRHELTVPERILWNLIRGGRLGGLKFRRQHPIGPYFADYYCHECKPVVELDGRSHEGRGQADRRREAQLRKNGLTVLRVKNDDVLQDLDCVAMAIFQAAEQAMESESKQRSKTSRFVRENGNGPK